MNAITISTEYMNLQEVASLLGVSPATIRNWVKSNYLTPEKKINKSLTFNLHQITELKQKIASGEVDRLNRRANKRNSQNLYIPDEYADNNDVVKIVQEIIGCYRSRALDRDKVLFAIAINLLENKGLIKCQNLHCFETTVFKNDIVKEEINWWIQKTKTDVFNQEYAEFLYIKLPEVGDILGLVYQSLIAEGSKSKNGSYYTPKKIVDEIVHSYIEEDHLVLDPCCGTGQFMLSIAQKVKEPTNIWGFDTDEIAVRLARLNLLLYFPSINFKPNIYHKNTLTDTDPTSLFYESNLPKFDVITTNPPWGVHFSKYEIDELHKLFPEIKSGEAFSYFIQKGLQLLRDGGILSFILPEAILNIKAHRDIREILTKETSIKKVKYINRIFKNVFTSVIRLDVMKSSHQVSGKIIAEKDGVMYEVEQANFRNANNYTFNVFTRPLDRVLFDKIYAIEHTTLKGKAEWALGIVTGNNKKYLSAVKNTTNEPILTGKDIKRFRALPANNFIEFNPLTFQQVASEDKYRAKEKLVYKFISKELVFSYDDKQMLTLNSANILIPKIQDYSIKTILALFNSSVYQFLYQKKVASFKALRGDIEQLPLPLLEPRKHTNIEKMVKKILSNYELQKSTREIYEEIDNYIMEVFGLNDEEKKYLKKSIKLSNQSLL